MTKDLTECFTVEADGVEALKRMLNGETVALTLVDNSYEYYRFRANNIEFLFMIDKWESMPISVEEICSYVGWKVQDDS